MKKAALIVAIAAMSAVPARAQFAGKLDLVSAPSLGAWQSLKSADQAVGVSKRVFYVNRGDTNLLNLGLFAGASKPILTEPSQGPRVLGGLTIAIPGSTLDWALGTNWGAQWAPALKTGLLCAYDLTRLKAIKAVPDFVGIGVTYKP